MPTRLPRASPAAPSTGGRALYELWGELARYPASAWPVALEYLMEWIAREVDADNVIWIGAVRAFVGPEAQDDAFLGWRLRGRYSLRPDPEPYRQHLSAYYMKEHYGKLTPTFYRRSHQLQKEAHIGLTSRASMAGAGQFRVHRLRDGWIDFKAFRKSLHYKLYYEDAGIRDRIWIGFPVNEERESFFLIDRFERPGQEGPRRTAFTLRQAALAGDAVRGVPEFHRRIFLGHGLLVGDKPLSPMEREIMQGLLTNRSEKQIAEATGQKPSTLHKYVTSLYARFGVRSRAALMALWLGEATEKCETPRHMLPPVARPLDE